MNLLVAAFTAISAVGGLGGIAAFAYVSATRRKINAEAKKLDVDADVLMSKQAIELYDRVSREAKDARRRIARLETHVRELEDVLRRHGITPPPFRWPPPLEAANHDEGP